jgi:hypothetical protein
LQSGLTEKLQNGFLTNAKNMIYLWIKEQPDEHLYEF